MSILIETWGNADGAATGNTMSGDTSLSAGMIFTCFFVMLGPLKLVFPFVNLTAGVEEAAARRIGAKALGVACVTGVVAAIIGQRIFATWQLSLSALHLAAGLVLLLVALQNVLAQYAPFREPAQPPAAPHRSTYTPLAFPIILSPYGIATFMLILAAVGGLRNDLIVFGLFLAVMALNLAVIWYARAIAQHGGAALAILGAVVNVLQVALALQMLLNELRFLHILPVS